MLKRSGPGVVGVLCICLIMCACKVVDNATGVGGTNVGDSLKQNGNLTRKELAQKLRRLAMSYLGDVPEACELIAAGEKDINKRLLALRIRVNSADSVISIAADPDPQVSLLNMVTVLTLQRMLAEERGEEFFGDLGKLYVDAAKRMEDEAWKLADQAMDKDEQKQLRELIKQYRQDHPNEVYVWWVRFSEFSAYQERFSIASLGTNFVDVFVPVGGAVKGIEDTTDVAERATWLAARQALIVQWRVELTMLQALSTPETQTLLKDIEKATATIDALPDRLAKEREAVLKAVEDQQGTLRKIIAEAKGTVTEVRGTVGDAKEVVGEVDQTLATATAAVEKIQGVIAEANQSIATAKDIIPGSEAALAQLEKTSDSLNKTLQTLDVFIRQFDDEEGAEPAADEPPARPFDITEYTAALKEATTTIEQLNTLVSNVDQAADPTRLDQTLQTLDGRVSAMIWQAGFVLVAVGLILIAAAKLIPRRKATT